MTAVNIQHLEILNDAIAATTGVRVRETMPDYVPRARRRSRQRRRLVEDAAQPAAPGQDLRPEKIEQALNNFFRKGNLSTLRELALRQLATDQAGEGPATIGIARVSTGGDSREGHGRHGLPRQRADVLRVGSRIAGRLASDWFAVYVETPKEEPGRIAPADQWPRRQHPVCAAAWRESREAEERSRG